MEERVAVDLRMVLANGLSRQASRMTSRSFCAPSTANNTCSSATASNEMSRSEASRASVGRWATLVLEWRRRSEAAVPLPPRVSAHRGDTFARVRMLRINRHDGAEIGQRVVVVGQLFVKKATVGVGKHKFRIETNAFG